MDRYQDTWIHDPNSRVDYTFNWGEFLAAGETIATKTVTGSTGITPEAPTLSPGFDIDDAAVANAGVTTFVTATQSGTVVCHITTSAGRIQDKTIKLDVRDR